MTWTLRTHPAKKPDASPPQAGLANALLLFVPITVTYLVASFVIFRFLLPHCSLNLHPHFGHRRGLRADLEIGPRAARLHRAAR